MVMMIGLITLAGVVVGATIGLIIGSRSLSRPILSLTDAMKRLAAGDYATEIPSMGRADEIGEWLPLLRCSRAMAWKSTA